MGYKLQKIYIGQNQVRPSGGGGRQPGANTTMYFKFNGDLKEEISGTTYTASGITYSDLSNGNKYANFPGSSSGRFQISNNISDSGNEITLLVWFQVANTNNMRNELSNSSGGYYTSMIFYGGNLGAYYYDNSLDIYGGSSWSDVLYNSNERHLYGQTIKAGGNIKIFLDGQKVGEKNMEATLRGNADGNQYIGCGRYGSGSYFSGKMSELIGEKVEWTETEMLNYYNDTKANYGIS